MQYVNSINLLSLLILLTCWNGSIVDQTTTPMSENMTPEFYGTLQDHHKKVDITHILIGGKFDSIPVYQTITKRPSIDEKNTDSLIDPKQNRSFLNLKDIQSIALKYPNEPAHKSIQSHGRTYISIIVTFLHGTEQEFLIESSRKMTCKEIDISSEKNNTSPQERDLNFIHIKKLTIKGFHTTPKKIEKIMIDQPKKITIDDEKTIIKKNTADIINSIEDSIKNLPIDNPTLFNTMRDSILILLKSLRDQLQKFLDMVK